MFLETMTNNSQLARTANQTSSSFVAKVSTLTTPTGIGDSATNASVIDVTGIGNRVGQNLMVIQPFGVGSNNTTFSMRVIGWTEIANESVNAATPREWMPCLICEVLCTLSSSAPGVAGGIVDATQYFADTLALTYPTAAVSYVVLGTNGADMPAPVFVDMLGFRKIEISFSTGSSATSCNALVRQL